MAEEKSQLDTKELVGWAIRGLGGLAFAALAWMHSDAMSRLSAVESVIQSRGERIAILEAGQKSLETGQSNMAAQLVRIEAKIDRLVERSAGPK